MANPTDDEIRSFCAAHDASIMKASPTQGVFTDLFSFAKTLLANGVSWQAVKKLIADVSKMFETGNYDYAVILADIMALFSKTEPSNDSIRVG